MFLLKFYFGGDFQRAFHNPQYNYQIKTIINNLASGIKSQGVAETKEEIIKKLLETGINPNKRPQDLNIKQIIELSTLF